MEKKITELALQPSKEEPKPVRIACNEDQCDKVARYSDGKCLTHSVYHMTPEAKRDAVKKKFDARQSRYADLHLEAATIAAKRGDADPAQWALLHGGVVKPLPKEAPDTGGITVNVGIALPGLGLDR